MKVNFAIPVAAALASGSATAQQTILNDDFSSSSYSTYFDNGPVGSRNPDDISTNAVVRETTGGNPDNRLVLTHTHQLQGTPANTLTTARSFLTNQSFTYQPSVDGPIENISFSLDVRSSDPFATFYFGISDVSGGDYYGYSFIPTGGAWQTITLDDLTNVNFPGRDFAGSDALRFGFAFISQVDLKDPNPVVYEVEVDNFQVMINSPVPEPGMFGLLFPGLLFAGRRRR